MTRVLDNRHPSIRVQMRQHWDTLPTIAQIPWLGEAYSDAMAKGDGDTVEELMRVTLEGAQMLAWRAYVRSRTA